MNSNHASIPVNRVIEKEDEYLGRNDYASAERHLLFWYQEARQGNDERGRLILCNELMGLYRKMGDGDNARKYSGEALEIVEGTGLQETIAGATAYLNSGTVYKAFGEPEKSLEFFEKAGTVYEKELEPDNPRKAGLYNNMALTLVDLQRFDEARQLYVKAIDITGKCSPTDEAITWLNLADLEVAARGAEEAAEDVQNYLDRAEELLDEVPDKERGSYYSFVCDKCAPVFEYYGYFMTAKKLMDRTEKA